MRDWKTLL
jgi:hypothetical protein